MRLGFGLKHAQKVILIMAHADTKKHLEKPFWEALKQNPFKQEYRLQMLFFKDKLPPVSSISMAVEDKNVVGALLLPLFMKSIDYVDPDGAVAEINLPSRKRKRGFGQGALADQPVAKQADSAMDTSDLKENENFDSALPEKELAEIKLAMTHVENEFVVLATWKKNFDERFPKCSSFVMINDMESKTVEPAGMIILSAVFKKAKQNANNDYKPDFVFKNRDLVCLGVARNVEISHVMHSGPK